LLVSAHYNETMPNSRMRAADRREQLIDAALDVFSRKGFRGATTKEIAAAAGVAEAIIFRHFPTKEALYRAVLDSEITSTRERSFQTEIDQCITANDDAGILRCIVRRELARTIGDPRFGRILQFAALEGYDVAFKLLAERGAAPTTRVIQYIKRRQREGAIQKCEPHLILMAAEGPAHLHGILVSFGAPVPSPPERDIVELLVRIALRGIAEPKPKKDVRRPK
jgi:TetR/AcrR family transcriptional regulator